MEILDKMNHLEFIYREALGKTRDIINQYDHEFINVSFSGGKDSTILLYLIEQLGLKNKVKVSFMNTMMEYQAQIEFINEYRKNGWIIYETKPRLPQPIIYKDFGKPFASKYVSEMISRLQKHNFDFKNDTYKEYSELVLKYPNCKGGLSWLTGFNRITIKCPKWIKKQLPDLDIKISNKCCYYLKKLPVYDFNREHKIKLSIIGVRKAEGGVRSVIYKSCFLKGKVDKFFPLLNWSDKDVWDFIEWKQIKLAKTYTEYGLERTGCVGCPFGRKYNEELAICEKYEPNKAIAIKKLYNAR